MITKLKKPAFVPGTVVDYIVQTQECLFRVLIWRIIATIVS